MNPDLLRYIMPETFKDRDCFISAQQKNCGKKTVFFEKVITWVRKKPWNLIIPVRGVYISFGVGGTIYFTII